MPLRFQRFIFSWASDSRLNFPLMILLQAFSATAFAADVVVVCPQQWSGQLTDWKEHRLVQGIDCVVIPPHRTANETRAAVQKVVSEDTRYVMLVGDAPAIGASADLTCQVPIHYRPTSVTAAWNSTRTLSTDLPYGDLDGDGKADLSVGRLPVDNTDQVRDALKKIIDHENCDDFGGWRNRVSLIGGVGGFGPLIDTTIESVTRSIVTGVLPGHAKTHVRFGSPGHAFYPKNRSFTQAVLDDYASGARFWVYAGHGQVTELDRVPQTEAGLPVLDGDTVKQLAGREGCYCIALMLACYTGAIDAHEDSIAEKMWLAGSGPVAVIAGSRVTMPYGNTSAAVGLIDAVYQQKKSRLGDAWLSSIEAMQRESSHEDQLDIAKQSSGSTIQTLIDALAMLVSPAGSDLKEERHEHAHLYNLIGDPTLALSHPEMITVAVKPGFDRAVPIELDFKSPIDGMMTITIDCPLGSKPVATEENQLQNPDPNELTIASQKMDVIAGKQFHSAMMLPADFVGPVVLRVHVAGQGCWATGTAKTIVR